MRALLIAAFLFAAPSASADQGGDFFEALKKNKSKVAAKLIAERGFKWGANGLTKGVDIPIAKHLAKEFRALKKQFKAAEIETGNCTSVGRELGYMAGEWKEKNPELAEWIRLIPDDLCNGTDSIQPKVWLIKVVGDALPRALVIFVTGEDQLITGIYHF